MKRFNTILTLFIGILFSVSIQGQERPICTIEGTVHDEDGNPLPYANVYFLETMEGAMSDEKGNFQFTSRATGPVTLICSYIGFLQHNETITSRAGRTLQFSIVLKTEKILAPSVSVSASAFTAADEEGVTLTAMDVVRTPGAAADIFWAVKSFPGLQQVEEGAGLFVRGGDVSETVFLLDGAIINHPYKYESPTGGFFGTFSPFLLKGTFFSSGGFSAQYGNALSGALAMESLDMPEERSLSLGVGLAAESVSMSVPVVRDKFGFSMSGNRSNTKMLFELNNSNRDFSTYPESYDFNLNAVYKIDPQKSLKMFVYRAKDKVGVEVDDPDYDTHFRGNSTNAFYNLRFTGLLGGSLLLKSNIAYSEYGRKTKLSVMDLDIRDKVLQGRITVERDIVKGSPLRAGLALFRNQTVITGFIPVDDEDLNPEAEMRLVDTDYLSSRGEPFLEWEVTLPWGVRMIPGLRGAYESITEEFSVDPRVSVIIPVGFNSQFTAAWGKYRQFPEPRYYDPYVGNPHLTSMRADHAIIGFTYMKDARMFRVEAYEKVYDRLLLEDVQSNYLNEGTGYARGLDVFLKDRIGRFSGWIAYSWLDARRNWRDAPVESSPYFDITHNLTFVCNVDLPKQFSVGTSIRYATGKPYSTGPEPEDYHSDRVPDYMKIDLSLSYLTAFGKLKQVVLYGAVSNLLGRINIFDYHYSDDWQRRDAVESSFGRSVYFGATITI